MIALSIFIPHETLICDDRDPSWFNNKFQSFILEKNAAIKKFHCGRNNSFIKRQLDVIQDCLITSTETSKQKYYCRMINK